MRKTLGLILIFLLPILLGYLLVIEKSAIPTKLESLKESRKQIIKPGADHSKFSQLQVKFNRPQDVTLACLACHNERYTEIMQTSHWRWLRDEYIEGKGIVSVGKRNIINNHCISINGSEGTCNRCHIGYGFDSKDFDFTKEENIDCLVCHDNSGHYEKGREMAGYPKEGLNFNLIAQSVGKPKIDNCGYCHFDGGGGNNSKHGDLESALYSTNRMVDVHLGKDAAAMECVDCHEAKNHNMKGKLYTSGSMNRNRLHCEDCHSNSPHNNNIINEHTNKVACQTCHIPTYAKVNATKMKWDWSQAGLLKDGKPFQEVDEDGNITYLSEKGRFVWEKHLTPEYLWFNGTASHYLIEDTIDQIPLKLNRLNGSFEDMNAKIYPAKIMRTIQPFDPIYNRLVSPKLWDKTYGKKAYWKDLDWTAAIDSGMKYIGMDWSGEHSFIETEMVWLLNHMVSPKEESLKCNDCHSRDNSRIAAITDVYLPGRDYNPTVDFFGTAIIVLTFFGVFIHGAVRLVYSRKNNGEQK